MSWKKFGKLLLFPHIAILILLIPISVAFLVFSLLYLEETHIVSLISYLLALYVLLIISFRVPQIFSFLKKIKNENKFIQKLVSDVHLRINIALYGSLICNIIFAIFQLWLGIHYGSLWFYSISAYHIILSIMRFFLLKHTRGYKANENIKLELIKYSVCGWLLLVMNLALSTIVLFIVYWNKTFIYGEITTIAIATYTFIVFTLAIINIVKYKKYQSPVYSATKAINLISASVSMLTLATTMLTTFGEESSLILRQIILGASGLLVSIITIFMALYMIINGAKKLKK